MNSGNPDASVDPGKQTLDAGYPGHSLQEICSADMKRARWGVMVDLPIVPPRIYGGIDMAGDGTWRGLKVEEAETQPHDIDMSKVDPGMINPLTGKPAFTQTGNCQGTATSGGSCGSGNGFCNNLYWGDNQEVTFSYNSATHVVDQMGLNLGYTGKMGFKDETGAHSYTMAIGDVIRKDGNPFLINWNDNAKVLCPASADPATPIVHWHCDLTELYNAAMFTFAPNAGIPYAKSKDCKADRGCLAAPDGGDGFTYFGIRPLFIYWRTLVGTPQPIISTPNNLYNFFNKQLPYSNLPQVLKLDGLGPYASGHPDGAPTGVICNQTVGLKFGDLLKTCVQVTGKANVDQVAYNKLIGGRTHDLENWQFNVVGVNQNISRVQGPFDVIQDTDVPGPNDYTSDFTFDVRAKGHPSNDWTAAGKFDAHGIRLVMIEWAREMLAAAAQVQGLAKPFALGDPQCTNGKFAKGCTGLEGLLIPGAIDYGADPLNPPATSNDPGLYDSATALSPGDPRVVFCNDLGTYADCDGPSPVWDGALQHVVRVMGKGNPLAVPAEMRDRRFYFKYWGYSLVKYYRAYGKGFTAPADTSKGDALKPTAIMNQEMDLMSTFFDNSLGNLFDKVEYIEREYLSDTVTDPNYRPWDFEYGTDVKFGNQRYDNWFHRMDREEIAMYTAMQPADANATSKTHAPASQNWVNLTNLFGSQVLASNWESYGCATVGKNADGSACSASSPVPADLDLNGNQSYVNPVVNSFKPQPLLHWYPAAWGQTVFSKGHSGITLKPADKQPSLGVAKVTIPNYLDPFNAVVPTAPTMTDAGAVCPAGTSKNANGLCDAPQDSKGALQTLVPWTELQPGVGFPVPISGTRDKQITTGQFDFTGTLETYIVDYEPFVDPIKSDCTFDQKCNAGFTCGQSGPELNKCVDGTIKVDAIEASDFVGEVFPCMAANGDLLHVGMYTSAHVIVDWLANHPGAQDSCDIVIRYSPFNNYIDFITSRANGVRMSINAGQGLGRVVDAILFDPTFAQQ